MNNLTPNMIFQDSNPNSAALRKQLIKNIIRTTECNITQLEDLFFSEENIDLINKQLILAVWKNSNNKYKIGYQDRDKLLIVMRYVFIENSKNLPFKYAEQIKNLNCIVVNEILQNVITNFEQKLGYLRDIERRGDPPPLPQSTNKNRTLTTNNQIF